MSTVASIVLAAGSGTRFGHSINKVWLQLNGKHIISRSLENSRANFSNVRSILVINPDDEQFAREALTKDGSLANTEIVHGGATRHESEYKALQYLKNDIEAGLIDLVLIHDGARPLATAELFVAIAAGAQTHGGAIPTIALDPREMDTARDETVARVQTPQGFRAQQILQAYEKAVVSGFVAYSSAPASSARAIDFRSESEETISTGKPSSSTRDLNSRTSSIPFITGMCKSEHTRSNPLSSKSIARAAAPSPAASQVNPMSSNILVITRRITAESSTTKALLITHILLFL